MRSVLVHAPFSHLPGTAPTPGLRMQTAHAGDVMGKREGQSRCLGDEKRGSPAPMMGLADSGQYSKAHGARVSCGSLSVGHHPFLSSGSHIRYPIYQIFTL